MKLGPPSKPLSYFQDSLIEQPECGVLLVLCLFSIVNTVLIYSFDLSPFPILKIK